ncbi:hypothetical protein [Actinomadura sp. NTSP31]|uniref:Rv1733c family protein n=1 Tax=Actinomadura sp. NTSP31 TaxID=1735447 RepID=UPI0035C018EE
MKLASIWQGTNRRRRSCGFDTNDLRREVDRLQWFLGLVLLIAGIGVASMTAAYVGRAAYVSGIRTERHEAATFHKVDAVVEKVRDGQRDRDLTVAWIASDGSHRSGTYESWRGASVGDHVRVWAGPAGVREDRPRSHARTIDDTAARTTSTTAATAAVFAGGYWLLRRRLDRVRYGQWDAAWADFDRHRIGP